MERLEWNNRAEYLSTTDERVSRPRFGVEDKESAARACKPGARLDDRTLRHRFQMIYFNSRAHADRAFRQMRSYRLRRREFHHSDHRRRGKNRREARIERRDRPLERHNALDLRLESFGQGMTCIRFALSVQTPRTFRFRRTSATRFHSAVSRGDACASGA